MAEAASIPKIDISTLFGEQTMDRDAADAAVMQAASGSGFMTVHGFPGNEKLEPSGRAKLLQLFSIPDEAKLPLMRRNFHPQNPNVYRGWFPLQPGALSHKEGIDMGPDIVSERAASRRDDPLCEPTPLPAEELLPGWRTAAAEYYATMERVGHALMRSLARGLWLHEDIFDDAFDGGISTLRLIRYPLRDAAHGSPETKASYTIDHGGLSRQVIGKEHVDSGFVTLLAQDGVEGLQAQDHTGNWVDVPPIEGTLVVNFGQLLERWTGGAVKATMHRVLSPDRERFSIPFFYEPRVDCLINPLPIARAQDFQPFIYGDYLWQAATEFVEMRGVRHLRKPQHSEAATGQTA